MRKFLSFMMAALFSASLFATTYTVAGDSQALFGTTWTPSDASNDMVLADGSETLYQWAKENVVLGAGSVAFKVCVDHAWTTAYPSANYVLSIPESGKYNVTISFDATSHDVGARATKVGDAVVIPTIAMHGNFTGSWANTELFTKAADEQTASLTLTLAAGTYEFGMRIGGDANWTSNGEEFTRAHNSAVVTSGNGNLGLVADAAGEYTFTWTYETNTLTITFPEAQGGEVPVVTLPVVKLAGTMNSWAGEELTPAADSLSASVKVNLNATTYEFKIISGNKWLSLNGEGDSKYGLHRDWNAVQHVNVVDGNNFELVADVAGEYTFAWTYADSSLVVTFPAAPEQGEDTTTVPVATKDLKLVPGVWTADAAGLTAWVWGPGAEGTWAIFEGAGDTLTAKIDARVDSVIFVRFKDNVEFDWNSEIWSRTGNLLMDSCGIFFVNGWDNYSWCEAQAVQPAATKDLKLVPGVWTTDAAGLTAWVWGPGAEGTWAIFEGAGDTLTAKIDARVDSVIFVRFKDNVEFDWNSEIWSRTGNLLLDSCGIFFVNAWDNYSWCEAVEVPVLPNYYVVGSMNNWKDSLALPLLGDSIVMSLEAGEHQFQLLPQDKNWDALKGYSDLKVECSSENVLHGENNNIKVTLAAAGDVKVKVDAEGKLCVIGNFEAEPHTYRIFGSVDALHNWDGNNLVDMPNGVIEIQLAEGDTCLFKVVVDDWAAELGYDAVNLECSSEGVVLSDEQYRNVMVVMAEAGTLKVEVVEGKLCVTGNFVVPETMKYYLVGTMTNWTVVAEDQYLFSETAVPGEYMLRTTLTEGQGIKVAGVLGEQQIWYIDGEGNEYVADADHACAVVIYFRPAGNTEWSDLGGHIYVAIDEQTGIQNTMSDVKAQKFIENGQLYILVNGNVYTVTGVVR